MGRILTKEDFSLLAQCADCHADSGRVEKVSKICVELDRARGMEDLGYSTALLRLTQELDYPKNESIVGICDTKLSVTTLLAE